MMKLLVLGASGGIGSWVARLASASGHHVRALVRPATPYEAPGGVEVQRGEALDLDALQEATRGIDAVLCCLGQRRAGQSPWSAPLSPPDLMSRIAPALVEAMRGSGTDRLVAVSAGGVADSAAQLSSPVRWLVRQGRIREAYRDLEAMEQTLAASELDWLAVRPVTLVDGEPSGRAREVERYRLASRVRRADVAYWMLNALEPRSRLGRRAVLLGQ